MHFIFFGFLAGVALGSYVEPTATLFLVFFSLGIFIFLGSFAYPLHKREVFQANLLLFGLICGMGRVYVSDLYERSPLENFLSVPLVVRGIVVEEPDVRDSSIKLTISTREISFGTSTQKIREKILVTTSLYPEFRYGDMVEFKTWLSEPKEFETDGRVFDYKNYLRARGIWYTGKFAPVELVSSGHGSFIKTFLFDIKRFFTASLERVLPQPEVSLLGGLLLGAKRSLGQNILDEFSHAGVSHVVVLSGYNIAIVAESIMAFLSFLPAILSIGFGAAGVLLFTIMSGAGASAVRAMLMVLVVLFAKRSGREHSAGRVLALAVTVMLLFNPVLLIFDPSFQLSVLATLGLIFVSPVISPYLGRIPEKFGLREIVSSTIATQMTVLPYLIYSNGIFSLVSLPVNILILGTIPLTMFLGFITGLFGFISPYLGYLPGLPTYLLLKYQLAVVHLGATLPLGWFSLPAFSFSFVATIYIFLVVGVYILKKKNSKI